MPSDTSPAHFAPVEELVNAAEFATMASRRLTPSLWSPLAPAERAPFERITLRPRVMVNTTKLDLTLDLFGTKMFAPIVIGPVSRQQRFHPEGELAMARGAGAAQALLVLPDRASRPLDQTAALCRAGFWYQLDADAALPAATKRAQAAIGLGAAAVCVTLSTGPLPAAALRQLRQACHAPLVLKGIRTAMEARACLRDGADAIVVSPYRGESVSPTPPTPLHLLPEIADAVAGKIPLLIDGGFVRGADMLKALALGARAVLIARPAVWGLAAYGADGVQRVTEMLQTELARDMAMTGKPTLADIGPSTIRLHRW